MESSFDWIRHADVHPFSWYFEAPQCVLEEYGLQMGGLVRISLAGDSYLCIARRRERPRVTIGASVSLHDVNCKEVVDVIEGTGKDIHITKVRKHHTFNSEQDALTVHLPAAFRSSAVECEVTPIMTSLLHGLPYVPDTWMAVRIIMTALWVRVCSKDGSTEPAEQNVEDCDGSASRPPVRKAAPIHWEGEKAVKDKLKYCLTSPSVTHMLISGPHGSGKMTLLKECLQDKEPFCSLIVSTSDLLKGKKVQEEYSSDAWEAPPSSKYSVYSKDMWPRVQTQIADLCNCEFLRNYSNALRIAGAEKKGDAAFPSLFKQLDANRGTESLAHHLIDIFSHAANYNYLVFKDFDSVFVQRSDLATGEQRQLTSVLLMLLDGVKDMPQSTKRQCRLIALVTDASRVDTALRRPGRLDAMVALANPTFSIRSAFIGKLLTPAYREIQKATVEALAEATNSMSLGDIKTLLDLHRDTLADDLLKAVQLHVATFRTRSITAFSGEISSCRVSVAPPNRQARYLSVHEDVLKQLADIIMLPILHRDLCIKLMNKHSSGNILCTGPSGAGKTTLVHRLVARLSGRVSFFELNCAQVFSLYVGHSERNIRRAFQEARENMPAVIIMDNYDALVGNRESDSMSGDSVATRVLATLLVELDGLSSSTLEQVTVLAITSRPEAIDRALIRPGRIDHTVALDHVPEREVMDDRMWAEIEGMYPLAPSDVSAIRECVRSNYAQGLQMDIGQLARNCQLLLAGAISLDQCLKNLIKISND